MLFRGVPSIGVGCRRFGIASDSCLDVRGKFSFAMGRRWLVVRVASIISCIGVIPAMGSFAKGKAKAIAPMSFPSM